MFERKIKISAELYERVRQVAAQRDGALAVLQFATDKMTAAKKMEVELWEGIRRLYPQVKPMTEAWVCNQILTYMSDEPEPEPEPPDPPDTRQAEGLMRRLLPGRRS